MPPIETGIKQEFKKEYNGFFFFTYFWQTEVDMQLGPGIMVNLTFKVPVFVNCN